MVRLAQWIPLKKEEQCECAAVTWRQRGGSNDNERRKRQRGGTGETREEKGRVSRTNEEKKRYEELGSSLVLAIIVATSALACCDCSRIIDEEDVVR